MPVEIKYADAPVVDISARCEITEGDSLHIKRDGKTGFFITAEDEGSDRVTVYLALESIRKLHVALGDLIKQSEQDKQANPDDEDEEEEDDDDEE